MSKNEKYIYALRYEWLTKIYDPFMHFTMREKTIRNELIKQANFQRNSKILDVGCGTGTLLILIKKMRSDVEAHGIDGDPKVLKMASEKTKSENVHVDLELGMTYSLPYQENYFDRVFSTLVFHHLTSEQKILTLREIYRVLKSGGELHLADFGKPDNFLMRILFNIIRAGDSLNTTLDNLRGLIPEYMKSANFKGVVEAQKINTMFGTVCLYKGLKA